MKSTNSLNTARVIIKVFAILSLAIAGFLTLLAGYVILFREQAMDIISKLADKGSDATLSSQNLSFLSTEAVIIWSIVTMVSILVFYYALRMISSLLDNVVAEKIFIAENVIFAKRAAYALGLTSVLPVTTKTGVALHVDLVLLTTAFIVWIFSQVLAQANTYAADSNGNAS